MKAKFGTFLVIFVISLAAMYTLAFLSERAGYQNLLLVTMHGNSLGGEALEKIEELCADEFLLTYEIPANATISAVNSKHSATLIGTNSAYPAVMHYEPLGGGFFSKSAWDSKLRHVTLNETAAFAIFGGVNISGATLKINGESCLVTGAIQDNDEEHVNIYAPSSVTGGQTSALMALMDSGNISAEAYVVNKLQDIGIREDNAGFINLSKAAKAFSQRLRVALQTAWCAAAALFVAKGVQSVKAQIYLYKTGLRRVYLRELALEYRADILKLSAITLLLLAGFASALYMLPQILTACLSWRESSLPARYLTGDFAGKLSWIYGYRAFGLASFAASLSAAAGAFITAWKSMFKNSETMR